MKGSGELKKTGELSGRAKDSRDYDPSADDFGSLISALYNAYHTILCDDNIMGIVFLMFSYSVNSFADSGIIGCDSV